MSPRLIALGAIAAAAITAAAPSAAAGTRRVDASFDGVGAFAGRSYVVRDNAYRRYAWASDKLDDGGSLPLFVWHLPARYHAGIDAAVTRPSSQHTYFFKGAEYVRYNWKTERIDYGPAPLGPEWKLPPPFDRGIDAVVNGEGKYAGKLYFFKGKQYIRYDWALDAIDQPAADLDAWDLSPPFSDGIDTVIAGRGPYAGKLYFVKGDQFTRYDWNTEKIDGGYPMDLSSAWVALDGLTEAAPRRVVLYITIDKAEQRDAHAGNLKRLRAVTSAHDATIYVDDWWAGAVSRTMLADPHVLAVFGAGSFTEWHEYHRDATWRKMLDSYETMIKGTSVPMLAVCGTHQLLGRTFAASWNAVGHMPAPGSPRVLIAAETTGSKIPSPRPGEHGFFPIELTGASDRLFDGLSSPAYFTESHNDEVVDGAFSPDFTLIGTASPAAASRTNHDPKGIDARAQVQVLRHVGPRILYTMQFHPELLDPPGAHVSSRSQVATHRAEAARNGSQLIRNFLAIAQSHWTP